MTASMLTPEEAVARIGSGDTVMVGGFGLVGAPLTLIDALVEHSDATDLTIVSNNIGEPGRGLGKLLRQGRIRRGGLVVLHLEPRGRGGGQRRRDGGNAPAAGDVRGGDPAGRSGHRHSTHPSAPAPCSPMERRSVTSTGCVHVLERPLRADVALVYAARADELGNLWYRRTARNFNPLMATAAAVTIAEAGEVVPVGEFEPESIGDTAPLRRLAGRGRRDRRPQSPHRGACRPRARTR